MIELDLDRAPEPAEAADDPWRQLLRSVRPAAVVWTAALVAFLLALIMAWVGFATFGDVFGVNAVLKIGLLDGAGTFDSAVPPVFLVAAVALLGLAWPATIPGVAQKALRGAVFGLAGMLLSVQIAIIAEPMRFVRADGIDHHDDKALSGLYYAMAMTTLAVAATMVRRREADQPRRDWRTVLQRLWPRATSVQHVAPVALLVVAAIAFLVSITQPWIQIDRSQQGTFGAASGMFGTSFGPAFMLGAGALLGVAGAAVAERTHGKLLRSATLATAGALAVVLLDVLQQPGRFLLRPLIPTDSVPTPHYHAQAGLFVALALVVLAALAAVLAHPLRPRRPADPPPPSDEPVEVAADEVVISR
jgi:hypothetical protein